MLKLDRFVKSIEKCALIILLPIMVLMGALQVISRFVIKAPISWSEGLLTYLFVWTSYIGASLALAERQHFQVDIFISLLPKWAQEKLNIFADICIIIFCLFLIYKGGFLALHNQRQMMGLIPFSMFWAYLSVPFAAVGMLVHALTHLSQDIKISGGDKS